LPPSGAGEAWAGSAGRRPRPRDLGRHEAGVNDYAAVQDETAGIWIDIRQAKTAGVWNGEAEWKTIRLQRLAGGAADRRDRDDDTFAPQIIPETIRPPLRPTTANFPRPRS
jgi:hypothetical protein